jgi:prepilin-type N-terminal cleavage/methylation domain-containing protein
MRNPRRFFSGTRRGRQALAFTLVELLVVIGVISILAALIFPVVRPIQRQKILNKARAELAQYQTAIEAYKTRRGHYPPDNPGQPTTNQLYYELLGTRLDNNGIYTTLDGSAQIAAGTVQPVFGAGGFVNSTKGGGEEGQGAENFLKGLKPGQVGTIALNVRLLSSTILWPVAIVPVPGVPTLNPLHYVASGTNLHNPNSYDLWIDVIVQGKTNRISNWSQDALIVSTPYY